MFIFNGHRAKEAAELTPFLVASFALPYYSESIVGFFGGSYLVAYTVFLAAHVSMLASFMIPTFFLRQLYAAPILVVLTIFSINLSFEYIPQLKIYVANLHYVTDNLEMKRGVIKS